MQDMDPGPTKILHKPEKGDTLKMLQPRVKRPVADSAARHRKISEEHQNYLPSNTHLEGKLLSKYYLRFTGQFQWEMAGFFNGLLRKRAKASRYCLHFLVKQNLFERSNWVNLHGAARLRNDFCQEKNYLSFKNKLYLLGLQDFGIRIVSLKYHHSSLSIPPN